MRKRQEEKKSRINICFFSGDITRSGGTERVACMIANGLCRYREFRVSVLSLVEQDPERQTFFDLDERIPHRALLNRQIQPGPEYAALIPVLRRFFIKRKIDVVIDIDIVLDVLSVPAACGMRTKVISWEHFNFTYETARRYGYRDLIVRHLTTKADVIVTLTQKDRQAFLRGLSKQGNTQKRMPEIRTIPNPIQNLPLQETAEKKRWIVTVGRLTYQKGVDYLLRTARIVLKKISGLAMAAAGGWRSERMAEGTDSKISSAAETAGERKCNGRGQLSGKGADFCADFPLGRTADVPAGSQSPQAGMRELCD